MDIENSPGAPCKPAEPVARDENGHGRRQCAAGRGGMFGICLCCTCHPGNFLGKRAALLGKERAVGVLWHHASVNLEGRVPCMGRGAEPAN